MTFEKLSLTDLVVLGAVILAFGANSFTSNANSEDIEEIRGDAKEIRSLILPMQVLAKNSERKQAADDELHTQMIKTMKDIQEDANNSEEWQKKHEIKEALECVKEGNSVDDCAEALE